MENHKLTFLLIHPEISRTKYNFSGVIENECLELEYISAVLKENNFDVYIHDGQVENVSVPDKIAEVKPDVVYVCGRTRQENFMLEYLRDAKSFSADTVTIAGGLHPQLCYERFYKPEVDFVLTTFDIYKIIDIVDYAIFNKMADLSGISGICYKKGEKWICNPSEPFEINRLPWPDRSYFYSFPNNYRYLELEHAAWVRTAYCCPFNCKFCHRNKMNGGKYVCRDIEDVVNEIKSIDSDNIYIVDDDFLFNNERLNTFIELVKKYNLKKKYICYGRTDFIAKNPDIMKALKDIGLYYVLAGLEATNDEFLNEYNKKSSVSNNIKAIEIRQTLDINIMAMFIIGLDYRKKDFKVLYKFIKEHNLKHVAISVFTPEMGLEMYDEYKDRYITDNPSHWDYLHVVAKPLYMSVKKYYLYYYILIIKLFIKAKREGVYDFIDYGDYIKSFIYNIFRKKRKNDDE